MATNYRLNSSGPNVARMQQGLNVYYPLIGRPEKGGFSVTGTFGPKTLEAIKDVFQQDYFTDDDIIWLEEQIKYLDPKRVKPVIDTQVATTGNDLSFINQAIKSVTSMTDETTTGPDKKQKTFVIIIVVVVVLIILTAVIMKLVHRKSKI